MKSLWLLVGLVTAIYLMAQKKPRPGVTIEKTGDITSAKIGDIIHYTVVVTNTSKGMLTNVIVNDAQLGIISQNIGALGEGTTHTMFGSQSVAVADYPGPIINTATVNSDQAGPASSIWSVSLDLIPS